MRSAPFRFPDRRRRSGGFTLVELMVALVISGIVMATVFQILNGQTQAVANQTAREESQQNVRGALEIVASELRTAIPQGIIQADAQAITFMQPRAWGIVCGSSIPGTLDAVFPGTQALGAFTPSAAAGVAVNVADAGHDWRPRRETNATRATVTGVTVLGQGEAGACAGGGGTNIGAAGDVVSVRVTADWEIETLVGDPALPARREVVLYSVTRYDVAEVSGRWWLRRSNGVDQQGEPDQQPLAGPLQGRSGFALTYYAADPATAVSPPGTSAAGLNALRMVRVRVATESEQAVNGRRQRDEGTIGVMLRNAP